MQGRVSLLPCSGPSFFSDAVPGIFVVRAQQQQRRSSEGVFLATEEGPSLGLPSSAAATASAAAAADENAAASSSSSSDGDNGEDKEGRDEANKQIGSVAFDDEGASGCSLPILPAALTEEDSGKGRFLFLEVPAVGRARGRALVRRRAARRGGQGLAGLSRLLVRLRGRA